MNHAHRLALVWCGACLLGAAYWSVRSTPPGEWRWQQECAEQKGEWVQGAQRPTCALQGGRLLVMGEEGGALPEECLPVVGEPVENPAKNVDFTSWPEAKKYRTAITSDYRHGANWNGRYVVALWGCPADEKGSCVGMAIVDQIDGSILEYQERLFAHPHPVMSQADLAVVTEHGNETLSMCKKENETAVIRR